MVKAPKRSEGQPCPALMGQHMTMQRNHQAHITRAQNGYKSPKDVQYLAI